MRTSLSACLIFVALVVAGCARAQVRPAPIESAALPAEPATSPQVIPALQKFPLGETFEYQISWWGVPVGLVTMQTAPALEKDPTTHTSVMKITIEGRSNAYLEKFYPVLVSLTSWVDPERRTPIKTHTFVRRRFRHHESTVTFDWVKKEALHRLPKNRTATVAISPTTQDGLALLYYVRTLEFHVGQTILLEITADGKNWHLTAKILRKSTVHLKELGSWQAVEGQAELTYPIPFFHGARARVWFSADEKRIPLLARIRSRIGPVSVTLTKLTPSAPGGL